MMSLLWCEMQLEGRSDVSIQQKLKMPMFCVVYGCCQTKKPQDTVLNSQQLSLFSTSSFFLRNRDDVQNIHPIIASDRPLTHH